ncbi:MAG: phosphohydrolase, partial [Clostridia bacterium]|nr:phosphohydrolase [Clostridia bacterium]
RVNYSVEHSEVKIDKEAMEITLNLTIDISISSVMDYFEIFLGRMVMCRKAAEFLGLRFRLVVNEQQVL